MSEEQSFQDLLNSVFDDIAQVEGTERPFQVTDAASADWVLRKLAAIATKDADDEAVAARLHDDITVWQDGRNRARAGEAAFFEGLLREWHEKRLAEDPDLKTITLPAGSISMRAQPAKWNRDESRILDWLEEQKIPTFTKKQLAWAEFKKETTVKDGKAYYKATGELVPSVSVVDVPDKFSAKPA